MPGPPFLGLEPGGGRIEQHRIGPLYLLPKDPAVGSVTTADPFDNPPRTRPVMLAKCELHEIDQLRVHNCNAGVTIIDDSQLIAAANGVKSRRRSDVHSGFGDGRSGVDRFVEVVDAHEFPFCAGLEDRGFSLLAEEEDLAVSGDGGGVVAVDCALDAGGFFQLPESASIAVKMPPVLTVYKMPSRISGEGTSGTIR